MSLIASTYKARDVEEFIDIYFYRPVGYVIARVSQAFGLTPNAVTILSIVIGITAGHLFYYTSVTTNLVGVLLYVLADAMDSADGQLARITKKYSRIGRVLDGFGGNLIFLSIYFHLCLRYTAAGGSPLIFLAAVAAGISHSFQSAMADYYRNAYLYFVYGEGKSELVRAGAVADLNRRLSWRRQPVKKFLVRIWLNYTMQQESLARNFLKLYTFVRERFTGGLPQWLQVDYARQNKPLLRYYNILTTNTRSIVLFICVLLDRAPWYFVFELTVLNALLIAVTAYQERLNKSLLIKVAAAESVAT